MSYDPNQPPSGQSQSPNSPGQPSAAYQQAPYYGPQPPLATLPPRKKSRRWLWIVLIIIVLVVGGGATAIALAVNAVNNSPAKTVVQDYYNAVAQQDYATAYSYLGIQTLTVNGQKQAASQDLYTQVAQSIDQANGPVTAYNITGIALNFSTSTGNTATITVDVTRGGKVQQVHLQLQQMGNDWVIVSIDHL